MLPLGWANFQMQYAYRRIGKMSPELYEGHLKRNRYFFQLCVSNIEGHELRTMTQKYVRQGENIQSQC